MPSPLQAFEDETFNTMQYQMCLPRRGRDCNPRCYSVRSSRLNGGLQKREPYGWMTSLAESFLLLEERFDGRRTAGSVWSAVRALNLEWLGLVRQLPVSYAPHNRSFDPARCDPKTCRSYMQWGGVALATDIGTKPPFGTRSSNAITMTAIHS